MIYFSTSKDNASLDEVLAGTVTSALPAAGSYMSEAAFGTVVSGGVSTKYSSFTGVKGASYFDALAKATTSPSSITADGFFVAGHYVWKDGVRRSADIRGNRLRSYPLSDTAGTQLGMAYGDLTGVTATIQLFTDDLEPLNGGFIVGGQLRFYYAGYVVMAAASATYVCYNEALKPVNGSVTCSKGQLVLPSGTKYVVAGGDGVCAVNGSSIAPVPFGTDLSTIGVSVTTSGGLSTLNNGTSKSPATIAGPWYTADGKPAAGSVGDYYFDLQGFSSYQPTASFMALYTPSYGVFYAPSDAHFAKMLTVPANIGTPFVMDLDGGVNVASGPATYKKAQPLTVGGVATYADSATAPTLVLLPNGRYPIGSVKGYRVSPTSYLYVFLVILALLLLVVLIAAGAFMVYRHKSAIQGYTV